ncbi:hypothetical protein LINPERHAP2_LOCUS15345 [Linum perenne]
MSIVFLVPRRVRSSSRHLSRGSGRRRTHSTWFRARRLSPWRMLRCLRFFLLGDFQLLHVRTDVFWRMSGVFGSLASS